MRVLVARDLSRYPRNPGMFETGLGYVLGLRALGHDVVLVEEVDPRRLYDPDTFEPVPLERWPGRLDLERGLSEYGVWGRAALVDPFERTTHGLPFGELAEFAAAADLLLDVSSSVRMPELFEAPGCRAFVDQVPARNQLKTVEYGYDHYGLERYEHHFTVGVNIGSPGCEVPTCGIDWKPALQPVFLPMWPVAADAAAERFTTLTSWASGRSGATGNAAADKAGSWSRFAELPRLTDQSFELTLRVKPGYERDVGLFTDNGWSIRDSAELPALADYRRYIAGSRAEFSVAQERYVSYATGWFSDRSARYLASGRPVLVQSTGFESRLPTGEGILSYSTLDEAVAGVEAINSDYERHRRAARAIAEEHFDAVKVVGRMLEEMDLEPQGRLAGARSGP